VDLVANAAGDDADLHGAHKQPAELGVDVKGALLGHDEEVAVGRVKGRGGVHGATGGVYVHAETLIHGRIACARNETEARDKVGCVARGVVKGIPSELVGDVMQRGTLGFRL
jgi:hypothetical protein